jgi:hypothetical protein
VQVSDFVPPEYLTIQDAIDRIVELKQGGGPLFTGEEWAILRDMQPNARPEPGSRDGDMRPADKAPPEKILDLLQRKSSLPSRRFAAAQELRNRLYAGEIYSETITDRGASIETPIEVWGGREWGRLQESGRVTFPYDLSFVKGRPLVSRESLESAYSPDGFKRDQEGEERPVSGPPSGRDTSCSLGGESQQQARPSDRRGRPRKWDWDAFYREIIRLANTPDGLPEKQSDLVQIMKEWCQEEWGDEPSDSLVRDHISKVYNDPARNADKS